MSFVSEKRMEEKREPHSSSEDYIITVNHAKPGAVKTGLAFSVVPSIRFTSGFFMSLVLSQT
jgi:hypothetical protein